MEAEIEIPCKDGERGYKPRNISGNKKLGKARKSVSSQRLQKECSPADSLTAAQ